MSGAMTVLETVQAAYTFPAYIRQRPFQVRVINALGPLERAGYYLDQGCVDSETEYLSPKGWVKIADYKGGKVGQYQLDGTVEFVDPDAYVKLPCDEMIRFKTRHGVDQLLSPEHRVLYVTRDFNIPHVVSAEEVESTYLRTQSGWKGRIPTTFQPKIDTSLPLSEAQLRLQVAVIADGYFPWAKSDRCVVRLKKPRKQARLRLLLQQADVSFREEVETWKGCEGFCRFIFYAPLHKKVFDSDFWHCSLAQLRIIADEVLHWDGSVKGVRASFSTSQKASADFIQYAFAACGIRTAIHYYFRQREGRKDSHEYAVVLNSKTNLAGISGRNTLSEQRVPSIRREPSTDGFKYCFEVPSTFLILRRNGCIFATGNTGKTYCATVAALYKLLTGADLVIGIMPPILMTGWQRWLESIQPKPSVLLYRTPKKKSKDKTSTKTLRRALPWDAQFVLMSINIFKDDFEHIVRQTRGKKVVLLIDEATSVKNVESANHQYVHTFIEAQHADFLALTGTPLSTPMDGYAFCKLVAPGIYRNLHQFETVHVAERDDYERVTEWKNLDLLARNMMVNARRVLRQEALPDLPPAQLIPLYYELDDAHLKLYNQLVEEQVLELENGGKIDATSQQKLFQSLQQIVLNWDHFSGNPAKVAAGIDLVDEILEELAGKKLVIFAKYRLTNAKLVKHLQQKYRAVGVYGGVSPVQQRTNLDTFIGDDRCKVAVLQPTSAGYGVDGLQQVCSDALFLEVPDIPRDFHQAVARLWRDGQQHKSLIRVAVAERTLQYARLSQLLDKDELVGRVCPNFADLRDMLFGRNQPALVLPEHYDPNAFLKGE